MKRERLYKVLPLLLLMLGAFLRLIYLGKVPGGMHQDEAFSAWNAFALFEEKMDSLGNLMPVYLATWGDGQSALYSWLLIPFYAILGEENMTAFVTRLPQAVIGILTLWAVYLLLKKMFGRACGLWGLFLLSICPWHVMMCRWGLDANLAPAFLIFGLYFFIKGLDDKRFLLLSALLYGIGLYSYAVIWTAVPVMVFLQAVYGLYHKKLKLDRWSVASGFILFLLALPLLLFVLVNAGVLEQINLPFMTIPAMSGYRAGELAVRFSEMWSNLRRVGTLLWRQNIGAPYDILLPYGLFYDIGRVFILAGFLLLLRDTIRKMRRKQFSYEFFIVIQLVGAGVVGMLVHAVLHQINCLYIPLVLCEAYGVWRLSFWVWEKRIRIGKVCIAAIVGIYVICLVLFQKDYYTGYKELVNAYFADGLEEAVEYAMEQGDEIVVEKGAQWPRILLFSKTLPSAYLDSVVYSIKPAPAQFSDGTKTFYIGINYDEIALDKVYIIYYPDYERFSQDFALTAFADWYVAVPAK